MWASGQNKTFQKMSNMFQFYRWSISLYKSVSLVVNILITVCQSYCLSNQNYILQHLMSFKSAEKQQMHPNFSLFWPRKKELPWKWKSERSQNKLQIWHFIIRHFSDICCSRKKKKKTAVLQYNNSIFYTLFKLISFWLDQTLYNVLQVFTNTSFLQNYECTTDFLHLQNFTNSF